jgi:hypothetical protein
VEPIAISQDKVCPGVEREPEEKSPKVMLSKMQRRDLVRTILSFSSMAAGAFRNNNWRWGGFIPNQKAIADKLVGMCDEILGHGTTKELYSGRLRVYPLICTVGGKVALDCLEIDLEGTVLKSVFQVWKGKRKG